MDRRTWMACLALAAAGCAASGPPPPPDAAGYDPEEARATLVAALDAWKGGRAAGLARRDPPIRFADEDLASGDRLVDYRLTAPDAPIRPFAAVPVTLKLRDASGRVVERTTSYQVTLGPAVAVLRGD